MLFRMDQMAKSLVFLLMLIGWSQAFPHHDVISENEVMKDVARERRDVLTDVTPPVCRVVKENSDCLLTCGNTIIEVTYIMSDGAGSGIDNVHIVSSGSSFSNGSQYDGQDENGYNATILHYSMICCLEDVEVSVVDKAGNRGTCPVIIKRVTPKVNPMTVRPTSSCSTTTISLWSSLILMALKSTLL